MARRSALILLLLVVAATPAKATPPAGIDARDQIEDGVAPARQRVAAVRAVLAQSGVSAAVRAGAVAAGRTIELPAAGQPPHSLEGAIASIAAAVRTASDIVADGPGSRVAASAASIAREVAITGDARAAQRAGLRPVEARPALRGAALIARALDQAMPALRTAALSLPAGPPDATCDILDSTGICVAGIGDNQHTNEHLLTIDLGGNDTYRNDCGFASLGTDVILDLAGNDRYLAPAGGHGFGSLGGIGMLVDILGDDLYSSRSTQASLAGQGLGLVGGVGVLFDGAGNDTYEMYSEREGEPAGAGGMGEAVLGGVGIFVDAGVGNDTHTATGISHPALELVEPEEEGDDPVQVTDVGYAAVSTGGIGVFGGVGLLADGGGSDAFTSVSRITAAPDDWPAVRITRDTNTGAVQQFASVNGQGDAGLAGVGLLLEGAGPTIYRQESRIESLPVDSSEVYLSSVGQGQASVGSLAALSDAGGNDSYLIDLATASSVRRMADDTCADTCELPETHALSPLLTLSAQGFGSTGGVGLIDDAGGSDTYAITAEETATARAHDDRTTAGGAMGGSAETRGPVFLGQGFGDASGGVGALVDALGDDIYRTVVTGRAEVQGTSALPENHPALLSVTGTVTAIGQGAIRGAGGFGTLLDLGGSDAYSASASAAHVTDGGLPAPGTVLLRAQGAAAEATSGLALAIDLDGIGSDTYASSPLRPPCEGTRGQGVWRDCGTYAYGINA